MTAASEIPATREIVAGIPNDIWTAASTVATSTLGFGVNRSALLIARAILAERQRCVDYVLRKDGWSGHRQEFAAALERGDVCDAFGKITRGNDI